jgi:hypothetical protein
MLHGVNEEVSGGDLNGGKKGGFFGTTNYGGGFSV